MKTRLEVKVGVFVTIGLVLLAGLMLAFSKGMSLFQPSYTIVLSSSDVSGLKSKSTVLMSGVQVGQVTDVSLAPDGKKVVMKLKIYRKFQVHKDAKFTIEQSGFLGDQYVAITPTENKLPVFAEGDEATSQPPFNFTETARTAKDLVARVEQTAETLNSTLTDVRRLVLNEKTMTNLAVTAGNIRRLTEKANRTLDGLDQAVNSVNSLLETNGPIGVSGSNLVAFSDDLKGFSSNLNALLATNTPQIDAAVSNIHASTATLQALLADVEQGKGAAGKLLRDEQLSANLSNVAQNLSITSSNLNRLGLWGILWKKKVPKESSPPPKPLTAPKK